jgi:hypothetical protein
MLRSSSGVATFAAALPPRSNKFVDSVTHEPCILLAVLLMCFFSLVSGPCIRKSDEGDPLLLERDAQHQREQDLQVHHGQALQPAVDRGAQPHHRRAHHRFLSPSPTECSIVLTGYYSSTFVSAISAAHHHRWHGVRKVWCSTRL